jgi:ABC-2 type transport system permease protein
MYFKTIVSREFRSIYRERTLLLAGGIIWLLLTAAAVLSYYQYQQAIFQRDMANETFSKEWNNQVRNPHHAAHFGSYLFKPLTAAALFDPGLNDYSGTTFRMEAHVQHEVDYSGAQDNDAAMRFGSLSLAMLLQLIIPLFIGVITASAITVEKEGGTWKMLLLAGAGKRMILWSKAAAYYLMFSAVLLPFWVFIITGGWWQGLGLQPIMIAGIYQLYYLLVVLLAITVSALCRQSSTAIVFVLAGWVIACILLPKIAVNVVSSSVPVMSRGAFEDSVKQGYVKGMGNDGTYYERGEQFARALVNRYHVDSISQLPAYTEGWMLQQNEDYQQQVFEHYYSEVNKAFEKQELLLDKLSFIHPFLAVRRLSMLVSGTAYDQHAQFYQQARAYRNNFIRTLNMQLVEAKMAEGATAKSTFFKSMRPFRYRDDTNTFIAARGRWLFTALLGWILLLVAGVFFTAKFSIH